MTWLIRQSRWVILAGVTMVLCLIVGQGLGFLPSQLGNAALASSTMAQTTLAQTTNGSPPTLAPSLPMINGNYEEAQGRFQIGILEGYTVSTVGGSPLLQAPDGSLAYTVAIAPLAQGNRPASEAELLRAAQQTFGQGEGFSTGDIQAIPGGGIRINWTGQLSQATAPPQPISGKIFARQRESDVFLLMVAATPAGAAQVSDAIITLGSTLKVP